MKNWYQILNLAQDTAEVRIYDNIGAWGITAKQFCADFNAIKAAKIDVRINSPGGEIFDCAAICTAIKEHPAQVTAHVDGLAASCASVITCACDSVQMSKSAFMMIHNPMTMAFGNADEMRKQADTLDKFAASIVQAYCDKTGKSKAEVSKAMDDETWFDAADALAWGLADSIKNDDEEDEDDAADPVARMRTEVFASAAPLLFTKFKNVPDRLKQIVASAASAKTGQPPAQENAMLNVILRDGKQFVAIDGKEHEIAPSASTTLQSAKLGKSDEEVAAAVNLAVTGATAKAKEDAIKEERAYRGMFNTVVASASLSGDAAIKFEKDFYGRPESDLKFLAEHAIGGRANPLGEGSGDVEKKPKAEGEAVDADIRKYCAERLTTDRHYRAMFKVPTANPKDPTFIAGLERAVAIETKSQADWKKKAVKPTDGEDGSDDPVSKALKNESMLDYSRPSAA